MFSNPMMFYLSWPYGVFLGPLVGLFLSYIDVRISSALLNRYSQIRQELFIGKIKPIVEAYSDRRSAALRLAVFPLGEELIRGLLLRIQHSVLHNPLYAVLLTSVSFTLTRPIPRFAKVAKFLDDVVLSILNLYLGVIPAWLAHLTFNIVTMWPYVRR